MASLHDCGWRQGSLIEVVLKGVAVDRVDGKLVAVEEDHELWVVVSQDCDLAALSVDEGSPHVEVRPVHQGQTSAGWGIRSRTLRLADDLWLEASDPRVMIAPRALNALAGSGLSLAPGRARALKTWLGLRYDRPAVPPELVPLARAVAQAVRAARTKELADVTHDVLFSVVDGVPPTYELFAVVTDGADETEVEAWLATAALNVDASLGVLAGSPIVGTRESVSLDYLENSYSADLSDITWGKAVPRGAA